MSSGKIIPRSNKIPHLDLFQNEQNILSVSSKIQGRMSYSYSAGFSVDSNCDVSNVVTSWKKVVIVQHT